MLIEMRDMALDILELSWPIIVIVSIIVISLRIAFLIFHHEKFVLYKELFYLFYLVYVLCLYQVVTYQDVTWGSANYIPFKEIFRYSIGDYLFYKNVIGNMLLFMPLGYFIKKYVGANKAWQTAIMAFIISIAIEVTQLVIGRVFDIDDIILNIFGSVVGYLIAKLIVKLNDSMPKVFKNEIFLNILALILLGGLVWFLIP